MDACEATKLVMSRVQNLDPENASKIMGYILIQDEGDKEMIRLAFGNEALLQACVNQVKARLGLPSNTLSAKPSANSAGPNSPFPPRIMIPSSPRPVSYAAVLNGSSPGANESRSNNSATGSSHFYGGRDFGDQLSFLEDSMVDPIMSPSGRSDSLIFPYSEDAHGVPSPHPFHRRSCSVNDAVFLSNLEEGGGGNGLGWRPCMYFARGFCKNGSSCKFLHGDGGEMMEAGSPSSTASGFDEYLRMKAIQQQRFAAMASGAHHSFPYNKSVNILNDNQRCGPRNGFSQMGLGAGFGSCSRQIYLTFPADSTFKEEDVSSYFSKFGPVQDVRIPFQPKRMFGFVTFLYPETVKLILAKGNPHYVCDSRVLVKPYKKDKGKYPDKKQMQQQHEHLERGCLSPSGVDSRELFDVPIGSRMLFNTQEMMLRRKLEQEAEIQHALELQSRRMNNMNLVDLESPQHSGHCFHPNLFSGAPISSSLHRQLLTGQNIIVSPDATNQDALQEFDDGREASKSPTLAADDEKLVLEGITLSNNNYVLSSKKHQHVNDDDSYLFESMEHVLPDNLFASPTKLAAEQQSVFLSEADNNITMTNNTSNNSPLLASSSPLGMVSLFYSETKTIEKVVLTADHG
ncbi:hypothetical protein CASFOL_035287 [Castilleja foliolosa]|uniref:Uncharacterized protein n=1 Tax=Castilleja foliolosa TaxID=1961234 RepID=A0ABD3BSE6_9LAMI